jgi:mannose-6-phosphate isomerase-like protein (cupin superfamily)
VNDSVLRLGILKGEFHWHKHDDEDEHFFVLEGELLVDTRSVDTGDADTAVTTFPLGAKQGVTVPRGTMHRTRSAEGAVVLMIAGRDVVPTGD